MASFQQTRFGPFILLALGSTLCLGCGLQDYEKKLFEQQKRVKYAEEEDEHLERRALQPPNKETKDGEEDETAVSPSDFFFRPPKGISTAPEPKPTGLLTVYLGNNPEKSFKSMMLAIQTREDRDKFQEDILKELRMSQAESRTFSAKRIDRSVKFEYYQQDTNKDSTRVYFYSDGTRQLAIAFRVSDSSEWARLETKIKYSLATVRTGAAAKQYHRVYRASASKASSSRKK